MILSSVFKVPYKYKGIHSCEAVVITCIDFRFWEEAIEFARKVLEIKFFDFPSLPGSAKAVNECVKLDDLAMKCVSVPCNLHHVKKIVIVNHEDCGAYGGSAEFESRDDEQKFHEGELKKAAEKIKKYYPEKEIILAYARLVDNQENILFSII